MKYSTIPRFALLVCICLAGWAQETPMIVKDGASAYTIVTQPGASPSEKHAAEELRDLIKTCTGAELPVVETAELPAGPCLILGGGAVAEKLGLTVTPEMGEQGYQIKTVGANLAIVGTPMAGTLYGVYDFAEECLGVRWYAPGVTKTPETKNLPLPSLDKSVKPAFLWRHTSYEWPDGDQAFRAHQRDNAGSGGNDNPLGTQYAFKGTCHSYFAYLSPGEFFKDHPEYFSEIGGVRRSEETQLCLTNPEVLDIVTERMLAAMKDNPGLRQFNFSQMDYYSYCECAKCRDMNEKCGTMGGTQYWFINQLAERTSKVYPDKLISTLAYMYTEAPPKDMVMHPNVAVWLCHMYPSCDSHPIATCPRNADYKRRAETWSQMCKHVYVWHYIVDFAHYYNPFPNFGAMAADMKFYKSIGVEGIYLQGMGHGGGGGEFSLLRPYYGVKLLWNPDADAQAIMKDFLQGYYGAAADPIYEYISMLQNKVDSENIHMHLYTNPAIGYLPDDVLAKAESIFDKAEEAVKGDEELLERVRVCRMPLFYAKSFPRNGYTIEKGLLNFNGNLPNLFETQAFVERLDKHGFKTIREQSGDPKQMLMLNLVFTTPSTVVTLENEHTKVDIIPFFGGRALRIIHKPSGKCITSNNNTRCLFFPFCGGEETRTGGILDHNMGGIFQQFSVTASDKTSATLEAEVPGGLLLERRIELLPDRPGVKFTITGTNKLDKPRMTLMRSHLELDLGAPRDIKVQFVNRKGENVAVDMNKVIAGMREGERYSDQNAPKDKWTMTDPNGLTVEQSFDDADLDWSWLYAYPDDLNDLEVEVMSKPVELAPGAKRTFSHTVTIGQ